jgi:hypothetical protein
VNGKKSLSSFYVSFWPIKRTFNYFFSSFLAPICCSMYLFLLKKKKISVVNLLWNRAFGRCALVRAMASAGSFGARFGPILARVGLVRREVGPFLAWFGPILARVVVYYKHADALDKRSRSQSGREDCRLQEAHNVIDCMNRLLFGLCWKLCHVF